MHMIREFLSRVSLGRPRLLRRFALAVPLVIASFAAMADSEDATGADFAYVSGVRITFKGASTNWVDGEFVLKYDNPSAASELMLPTAVDAWVLAVGGGGAGGSAKLNSTSCGSAGGGGGGQVNEKKDQLLMGGTYTIAVGAGGVPSAAQSGSSGGNGQTSKIMLDGCELADYTAIGGGGGGVAGPGNEGASGGGGSFSSGSQNGGAATAGHAGGSGAHNKAAGGGGGAGSAGSPTSGNGKSGNGGDGTPSYIAVEEGEDPIYYAAGGGGGTTISSSVGSGGKGGGGNGGGGSAGTAKVATPGEANTGSGGGGGSHIQAGGAGGSGVVIIRIRKVMPLKPAPAVLTWLYDGQEHAPVDVSDGSHVKVQKGTAAASDAGTYELTVAPADGYVWSDGETEPITFNWKISKRTVTLTSADDSWTYDGQAHSNTTVTVGGDGFAAGEGLETTSGWATITDVGTNDNTFAYTLLPNTHEGNYDISVTPGRISVVAAPVTWPEEWPQDADDDVRAKFDAWKDTYGVDSFAGKEDAFLMNADPVGTVPALRIESIVVADGVATIVVGAEGVDLEKGINGKLYVDASDDLVNWTTTEIDVPLPGGFSDGKATFEVESGKFMRAKVGIKVPAVE